MSPLKQNHAILSNVAREVLREVREQHRLGRLGFLIGAGLSVPIGLPGWAAFNQSLLEHAIGRHAPGGAAHARALSRAYLDLLQGQSLTAVDLVRQRVGGDFHVVLRGALYEREQLRKFQPTEVHYALCKLALDSQPPYPCVHTTNYDDLIELAIANMMNGKRPRAVHAGRRSTADGPRVVHLHGYFPFDASSAAEEKRLAAHLVASDLDYHRLSNEHAAWTNRELMTLLDARSVLIVGMSLTDPNVRRLLAYLSEHKKAHDEPHDHYVILQQRPPLEGDLERAREMVEEDEHEFWRNQGVKILRLGSWDGLNYILRRIRFTDEQWDKKHRELRIAWATANYGAVDFSDTTLQELGTELLAHHRDLIVARTGLGGRVELNLFLPMLDGRYRRALSSMPGRASAAPRWFTPTHDSAVIPEVELALTVGEGFKASARTARTTTPPAGEPPYQDWYESMLSVPYFDYLAGGIPVALLQLVSSDASLAATADPGPVRTLMREAITGAVNLLRGSGNGPIMEVK